MQLLKPELSRLLAEIKNYKLNNIVSLLDVFLICLGIFMGTGQDIFPEGTLFYALIGMILWRYTVICLQTACGIIQQEMRLGTLEQLMLASHSLLMLVVTRLFAKFLVETVKLIIISFVLILVFQIQPDANMRPGILAGAMLLCLAGTIGIGCLTAGVALIYKKADALVNSISYFTLFFTGILVPLEILPGIFSAIAKILPFYWCVTLIRQNTAGAALVWLLLTAALWVGLGIAFFSGAVRKAIAGGTTSGY